MKVLAINGSPRKGGNTEILIRTVFQELEKEGIETELVQVGGKLVHGCIACMKCREIKDVLCHIKNDFINQIIPKMVEADGILLGSPVYYGDITSEMKAMIDISGYVTSGNGHLLRRKVGAAVIVERRGGAMHAFETLNNFFLINQMIIPGSSYWNFAFGRAVGDVLTDTEGLQTMRTLGENMAWVMKKLG